MDFSGAMHCQIGIFEQKMMVKIGIIFMPFLDPICHFRGTADFTRLQFWKIIATEHLTKD